MLVRARWRTWLAFPRPYLWCSYAGLHALLSVLCELVDKPQVDRGEDGQHEEAPKDVLEGALEFFLEDFKVHGLSPLAGALELIGSRS